MIPESVFRMPYPFLDGVTAHGKGRECPIPYGTTTHPESQPNHPPYTLSMTECVQCVAHHILRVVLFASVVTPRPSL